MGGPPSGAPGAMLAEPLWVMEAVPWSVREADRECVVVPEGDRDQEAEGGCRAGSLAAWHTATRCIGYRSGKTQ